MNYNNIDNKKILQAVIILGIFLAVTLAGVVSVLTMHVREESVPVEEPQPVSTVEPIESAAAAFPDLNIQEAYLTPNPYSRPETALEQVNYIVIHYTANPGSNGMDNRDYFESLKDSGATHASSHFIVGLQGEIIQCIPLDEWCYASNTYNDQAISIEMCHPDDTGDFTNETYNSTVFLVAKLCDYYGIPTDHVIRHYDITGKNCPKFFVEKPKKWEKFLGFVDKWREDGEDATE